ncbi:SprT family zinc-dependent metalloprotease [Spirosoma rhododendri]|uniref:SprT family zinc-dependent metalloprotease n=1 Tax=Spirosoma rhododendri TaxID=2728024 RepID=A0A7L5DXA6_9BACT|nr:SprT family zinc-dependent metalloprotease [Spirosoma rhododendri]
MPAPAAAYCQQLHQTYSFAFQLARSRRSRLGDFRVWTDGRTQITVNADLNPWRFLITYVHEVAHAHVNKHNRRPTAPHGPAWQLAFQQLMQPLLTDAVFFHVVLEPLRQYLQKPAATTYGNATLTLALRQLDTASDRSAAAASMTLADMAEGTVFTLNKKKYVRGTLRRTRVVCKELASGKSYTVVAHAWVELA